jgi:hypothetical protein
MKFDKILFWVIIIILSIYVLYYLGFTNNTFENFVAGVNEYVDTGYGNITYDQPVSTHELLNETTTVFGHTLPETDTTNAPLGDGEERLFMLGKNKCSPDCCPSTYTCSSGCVCTTEEQRNRIRGRK